MLSTKEKKLNPNKENANLDAFISLAEERGFEIKQNKDVGAGPVDVVFKINIHPSLPSINCGFIVLRSDEGGSKDYEETLNILLL